MRRNRGFTLLEIIIVVAIIGILAAVAFPSYQNHIRKSNRAAAQAYMMDVAQTQQVYLSTARSFATSVDELQKPTPAEVSKFYTIALTPVAGPPPGFTISATPKAGTMQETDGPLTLDDKGTKTPSDKW